MQACVSFLVLLFSALLLASPVFSAGGSAPSVEGVSPRCEADLDRAAGRYSKCLLSAKARSVGKQGTRGLERQQDRCEKKFERRIADAIRKNGKAACPASGLLTSLGDRTVTSAEALAMEAGGVREVEFLFIQNADGGTLMDSTLTLTGVDTDTILFADRPTRVAKRISTGDFVAGWNGGEDSFANGAPNAGLTCAVDGKERTYVVTLADPLYYGGDLSYSVSAVGPGALPTSLQCDAEANLFIDSAQESTPSAWTLQIESGYDEDLEVSIPIKLAGQSTTPTGYPKFSLTKGGMARLVLTDIGGSGSSFSMSVTTSGGTEYKYSPNGENNTSEDTWCKNKPPLVVEGGSLLMDIFDNSIGFAVVMTSFAGPLPSSDNPDIQPTSTCNATLLSSYDSWEEWCLDHFGECLIGGAAASVVVGIAIGEALGVAAASLAADATVEVTTDEVSNLYYFNDTDCYYGCGTWTVRGALGDAY